MKKSVKIVLIVVGCIVGLLMAVLLLVSPIAKHYIEKHDKELIGRELSIGKLRVNALFGTVKMGDLTLYEDDGTTPFVSFDHFETSIKLRELLNNRLWVRRALLSGLKVNVEQDRTWFNFNSMVEHFATDEPQSEEEDSDSDFGLVFNDVSLERSYIRYADLDIGSEFNLRDVSLYIPYVDLSNLKTNVGLDLHLADSATLHTDLRLSENADAYFIDLKLNDLGIDIIEPYLQQTLAVDSLQGRLSLDVAAEGRTEHILDFDLTGDLFLDDVALDDTLGNALGSIHSIWANIGRFNLNQNVLSLNNLRLSGLEAAYIIHPDSTTNLDLFLGHRQHADTTVFEKVIDTVATKIEEVQEKKSLVIDINELQLDGIHLVYQDCTLPDTFRYEISDIAITSEKFNLSGNNTVRLDALLNHAGRLHVDWKGNINGLENHDLTLMLSNVKVSDFSPYSQRMFGFPLNDGTLSFQSQNKVVAGNLEGLNKLQIASPEVGKKLKGVEPQYNIPLKLGLYLLTDKNHNVSIDLPISGNLNDPQFSYGKALLKVFGNLLVKVVTSPFRLFSDDGDIQYIPFDLLEPDFSAEQYAMIDNVASTLHSQPQLSVVLEEQVNYETTLAELCNLQLQRDYYLTLHPELDSILKDRVVEPAVAEQGRSIETPGSSHVGPSTGSGTSGFDFLTNEAIRAIKLNDKGLCDYAAQFSEKEKLHSKKEVAEVAYAVYHESSEALLHTLMQRRNAMLVDYLHRVKCLTPEQASVTQMPAEQMSSFDKPSRYALHVAVEEESGNEE